MKIARKLDMRDWQAIGGSIMDSSLHGGTIGGVAGGIANGARYTLKNRKIKDPEKKHDVGAAFYRGMATGGGLGAAYSGGKSVIDIRRMFKDASFSKKELKYIGREIGDIASIHGAVGGVLGGVANGARYKLKNRKIQDPEKKHNIGEAVFRGAATGGAIGAGIGGGRAANSIRNEYKEYYKNASFQKDIVALNALSRGVAGGVVGGIANGTRYALKNRKIQDPKKKHNIGEATYRGMATGLGLGSLYGAGEELNYQRKNNKYEHY